MPDPARLASSLSSQSISLKEKILLAQTKLVFVLLVS